MRVCAFRKSGERLGGERGVGTRENMAVNVTVRDTISYPCYTYPLPPTACVLVLNKRCSVDSCSGCTQTEQQAECRQGYSPSTFSLVLPCTCRYNGRPSLRMRNILTHHKLLCQQSSKCPLLVNFQNWQVLVGPMNNDKQLYIPNHTITHSTCRKSVLLRPTRETAAKATRMITADKPMSATCSG